MIKIGQIGLGIFLIMAVVSCTMLTPRYETPGVNITAFRLLPISTGAPQFEIELHIVNPNDVALELIGVAYTVSIDGHKLLSGVSNQLPLITAYGDGNVTITAVPDMLEGVGLVADLIRVRRNTVNYDVQIKLDVGRFLPAIHVNKMGKISLLVGNQW